MIDIYLFIYLITVSVWLGFCVSVMKSGEA